MHPNSLANLQPPIQKGEVRNPYGRPKQKTISEYAREHLAEVIDKKTGKTRGQQVAEEWIENAVVSPALLLELLTRTEGKVTDKLDVTSGGKSLADLLLALKQPSGHSD